jgi:inward rectifier potassium channel
MFRIANSHNSEIIEANAKVMVAVFTESNGEYKRSYFPIELERSEVMFFPLSWTLVHMIDEKSPLFSLSIADMEKCETEVIVLISGYDETLNERFYSKHSYTADQFLENHRFLPAFDEGQSGTTMFDVKRIHDTVEWM